MDNSRNLKTVVQGKWGVSVTTGDGIDGARLNVYSFPMGHHISKPMRRGIADGMVFATQELAAKYAQEHGYTQPYYKKAWKFSKKY